jgi:transcriptional regulator with XRE-family HTH domain
MSKIGNNIKKIRSIKNLNQNDFAELFKLKRATIGAYEEGRAEPKVSTLLEIANHFGIGTDDLLKKDLSVNDLYRFDIFRDDLIKGNKHNLNPSVIPVGVIAIPFISEANRSTYYKDRKSLSSFENINIPIEKGFNYRAFEISDSSMFNGFTGPNTNDIIVAKAPEKFGMDEVEQGKIYLFEKKDELLLRLVQQKSIGKVVLQASNPNTYNVTVQAKEIIQVWQVVKLISNNISTTNVLNTRITLIENELSSIKRNNLQNG